jgi:hypothetical protein
MKVAVFWDVASCSLADHWSLSTRLHGETSQERAIFNNRTIGNKVLMIIQ